MPRQSKNQATILMDELKSSLKHRLETLNRIYMEAVSEKNFETIIKCDVEFNNINEQINSFPETKNLVKDVKMEEEFKILSLFFKNVAEGCIDPKTGKCVKAKKAPAKKTEKKVEKKEESDTDQSDSESSDDESEEKKPTKAKKVTKKPVAKKEEKKEEKITKRKAPAKATGAKPDKKAHTKATGAKPAKKAKKEESDSDSSDSDSSDYSESDSSDSDYSTDSEDELEFDFYDDMSKIRKFEKQAKSGTITGKQAEEKCKKLILAMPKKYRTLTDRKIKSTIKDLLASI